MSLKYAILTILIDKEQTGYDLTKTFENSIGYYWSASHQQIYKTLSNMLNEEWVSVRVTTQDSKPDKKLYSITKKGELALREWVVSPTKRPAIKNQLLIKLLLAPLVGKDVILEQLQIRLTEMNTQLEIYKGIEQQYFNLQPTTDKHLKHISSYLTLRNGILHAQADIDWLNETIESFNKA